MILTIRAHKRYAVRQPVCLRSVSDEYQSDGLLIELSTEGCRISGLDGSDLSPGHPVVVERDEIEWHGRVCWVHSGIAGVRLDRPLTTRELTGQLVSLRNDGPQRDAMARGETATLRRA